MDEVRADEPTAARHEDFHALALPSKRQRCRRSPGRAPSAAMPPWEGISPISDAFDRARSRQHMGNISACRSRRPHSACLARRSTTLTPQHRLRLVAEGLTNAEEGGTRAYLMERAVTNNSAMGEGGGQAGCTGTAVSIVGVCSQNLACLRSQRSTVGMPISTAFSMNLGRRNRRQRRPWRSSKRRLVACHLCRPHHSRIDFYGNTALQQVD